MVVERSLNLTSRYHALCVVIVTLLFLWGAGRSMAIAVFAGGLLMGANFSLMRLFLSRLMAGEQRTKLIYGLMLVVKFVAVLTVLAWLVLGMGLDPLGLIVGVGILFLGLGLAVLHAGMLKQAEVRSN